MKYTLRTMVQFTNDLDETVFGSITAIIKRPIEGTTGGVVTTYEVTANGEVTEITEDRITGAYRVVRPRTTTTLTKKARPSRSRKKTTTNSVSAPSN